jgi:hypothetical protein
MPPRIPNISVSRLDALEQWLDGLGMKKNDRVHQAIRKVRAHYFWKTPPDLNEPWYARTLFDADHDVIEFLDIFDAFQSEPHELIAPKIERASSGLLSPVDERAEKADARNMQFELSLAAEWRLNGLNVTIGEPDFTLSVGTTNFIVECKRPYSEGSVRSNIKEAKRQLAPQLDKDANAFGAIAISVSRIVVPPSQMLISDSLLPSVQRDPERHLRALLRESRERAYSPEDIGSLFTRGLGQEMDALAKRVRWRNFDCHERVVGIFFHAAPHFAHASGLDGRLAVSIIGPIGTAGPAFTYLESATDTAYNQGWRRPLHRKL